MKVTLAILAGIFLPRAGHAEEGLELCLKAYRIDPYPPTAYGIGLAGGYFFTRQFQNAIEVCEAGLRETDGIVLARILALCHSALGNYEQARRASEEHVKRIAPRHSFIEQARYCARQEDRDLILRLVEEAGLE